VTADGGNVSARLLEVREYLRLGQPRAAVTLMGRLMSAHPDDARVLVSARALYTQAGQLETFVSDLQQRHAKHPANLVIAAQLADVFTEQRRAADATRVLDATRAAVGAGSDADPDLLYEVAHLYTLAGQAQASEQVLRDVVRLDPAHAAASNDLGYVLADEGRDLEAAEAMTRRAVDAEPGNGSFLDSLGWVLYKRGRLEESRRALGRAVELSEAPGPDPVVLDHLGDALYQLGDAAAAADHWKRAVKRLGEMPDGERQRDELAKLRLRLDRKTRQADAGQPVSVAPVVEKPLRRPPSASQPAPAPLQSRRQGVQ
jgi:tetratricopeptide (TPR) repeat protein